MVTFSNEGLSREYYLFQKTVAKTLAKARTRAAGNRMVSSSSNRFILKIPLSFDFLVHPERVSCSIKTLAESPQFLKQKFDQETGPKPDKTGGVLAGFMKPDMPAADGAKSDNIWRRTGDQASVNGSKITRTEIEEGGIRSHVSLNLSVMRAQ